jgi:hypothetical protein
VIREVKKIVVIPVVIVIAIGCETENNQGLEIPRFN